MRNHWSGTTDGLGCASSPGARTRRPAPRGRAAASVPGARQGPARGEAALPRSLPSAAGLREEAVRAHLVAAADGPGPRREFNFGVASQSETHQATSARLLKIRFPAHLGVAGWVLAHDEAAAVPDAQQDPRFYNGVDQVTNITTHAILCAPLRARSGSIG